MVLTHCLVLGPLDSPLPVVGSVALDVDVLTTERTIDDDIIVIVGTGAVDASAVSTDVTTLNGSVCGQEQCR